jgi:hypothetical protein
MAINDDNGGNTRLLMFGATFKLVGPDDDITAIATCAC